MTKISLSNINFAKTAKKTAVTVYLMTGVKAAVRPAFIMGDKKNDAETNKYTAVKEVLYQVLCVLAAAAMFPAFERGGFKLAEKSLAKLKGFEKVKSLSELPGLENIKRVKDLKKEYLEKTFDENFVSKLDKAKEATKKTADQEAIIKADEALHYVNGGVEAGSLLASILGLTLLAPMVSHEILHPFMSAIGIKEKAKDKNIGKPTETFLADAKVPIEKGTKISTNA